MTSVAFLADQVFATTPGGMGTYVRRLVPALEAADPSLDVTLFHARFEDARPETWMRAYWSEELTSPIRSLYPSWAIAGRPSLPDPLASKDIVHSPLPVAIPPKAKTKARRQRLVVTVHDVAFLEHPHAYPRTWRLLYRAALIRTARTADAVIAVSRHTAEDLARHTKIDRRRIHVTPLGPSLPPTDTVVDAVLDRLKIPPPYVLFVGTLEPRKNLVRLVRAYRRAAARGVEHALVLAGAAGWNAQPLLREIGYEGPGRVVLTGHVPDEELDALYRGASAFVYPSLYEGFGIPVLDAMARGVPSVVSSTASLPEVAGEAAVPVDPRSTAAIAEAIERVLRDRDLADRLREAGLRRAARFSWEETARLTLEAYKQVLQ
jgi:glycosyltransferase involved in cell wall biosynthesis